MFDDATRNMAGRLVTHEYFDSWVDVLAENDNTPLPGTGYANEEPIPGGLLTFY